MTDLLQKTRNYVEQSFGTDKMPHFDRTLYWVLQLKPDADEALQLAALGHDLERPFRTENQKYENSDRSFLDTAFLTHHQTEGARILGEFLQQEGASEELVAAVKHLVERHELGGDEEQNILQAADSVSFMETNVNGFLQKVEMLGYARVKEKIDWMFERIQIEAARDVARPLYEQAVRELENLKNK